MKSLQCKTWSRKKRLKISVQKLWRTIIRKKVLHRFWRQFCASGKQEVSQKISFMNFQSILGFQILADDKKSTNSKSLKKTLSQTFLIFESLFLVAFFYGPPGIFGINLITANLSHQQHEICENTGFHWPVFSCIRISENPHSRIFCAAIVGYSH